MLLICPACAARYTVPDGAVPPAGRRVRCKACAHLWTAMPEPMLLGEPAPPGEPAPAAPAPPAAAPPHRGRRLWMAVPLLLAAGVGGGWLLASRFGVALPPIGLPTLTAAAPTTLTLTANAVNRPVAGGGNVWEVSGVIVNNTDQPQRVPPVEVTLLADGGREFYRWQVPAPANMLAPGQRVAFETATVNTPADARLVRVALRAARA